MFHLRLCRGLSYLGIVRATKAEPDVYVQEEEKANAKKLHAVKMLEKYYIYLSEEETGILERMLEDCKRRKREYALEED